MVQLPTGLLAGKSALVVGIANENSIAYGCAKAFRTLGAELAITYLNDKAKPHVAPLAEALGAPVIMPLDVRSDDQLDALFSAVKARWGALDVLVHSIAYAPRAAMEGDFFGTARGDWDVALNVSAYSLVAAAQRVVPLMTSGGSIMTLTYLGADRYFPGYNVMGVAKAALEASVRYLAGDLGSRQVRVNAISAGPMKTAAARGIPGFQRMFNTLVDCAPLESPFNQAKVAGAALFLASDLSAAVSGETIFVDNGYHAMGMSLPRESAADEA